MMMMLTVRMVDSKSWNEEKKIEKIMSRGR